MKRTTKILLLIFAVLTVLVVVFAIIMLNSVSGDSLLYMNSTIGKIFAVSYHWFLFAAIVFLIFWILLAIKNRKVILGIFLGNKQRKAQPSPTIIEPSIAPIEPTETSDKIFCTKCGKQISAADRFCQFCGCSVNETAQ